MNICELCGNDAHYDYDCSPQVPFVYNQNPCFDQNFDNNFPQTSPSFPQQYLCCENCGGPHATFQCQPMNQNLSNSNSSGFDQFQPPQYPVIHHSPQATDTELKVHGFIANEERFLKIKQAVEEEQNQPEDMQELLLKLMDDLQILKGIQQEKKKPAAQSFTPYGNFSMIDDVEVLMKDIYTFLRKFSRIPFGVTPKVILIAWERFGEINEELSEYINCPSWNRPIFYDDDDDGYTIIYRKPKAITPDLPIEEPDNSLIMGDEHLDTIPEIESDEIIKSSVEILVPIPSEFEGISDDTCDVPICEDPSTFDALSDHSEILSDSNDDGTSSDDNDFEDIEYVSLEEVNDVDQEEKEFDLEDILQIQDVILREKLLNISRLITNIESLNDNPTPDHVFKSPSSFPIPVTDSDSFFEKSDTSLSYSDNSLPEFEPFSDDTEETRSGSTTTHANNSLPEYDSFLFEIEPDQGELTNVVIEEVDTFLVPEDSIPPGIESNFYPGGGEINISQNVEDDDSFTFVIRTFLPFLTYPADSPLLLSTRRYPDFEDSRVHGFVHSYIRASYPQLHLGNLKSMVKVSDISKRTKTKLKWTNPSTGLEEQEKIKAENRIVNNRDIILSNVLGSSILDTQRSGETGIGYIKKDKNEAKMDKSEHGIGRAGEKRSRRHIHF
ncbi:hypothetical protein Tco_1110219 [Tanacetum coccineum]|uniref:Uncharacterized protein n=1 Tax=Tanacetum coccineum TaxID=301880 RepID=A0ABQ5IIL2_9ASTR